MAGQLRATREAVRAGRWRPAPPRRVRIPKAAGGTRELSVSNHAERVLGKAVQALLDPVVDPAFLDASHGFRPGRSHLTALAALDAAATTGGRFVLTQDDVQRAFDAVRVDDARAALAPYLSGVALLDLVTLILRGHDPRRHMGIPQGNAISPLALNALLHRAYDRPMREASGPQLVWLRYADNLLCASRTVSEGDEARARTAEFLCRVNLALKGEDGGPTDIREGTVELLGFRIGVWNGRIGYAPGRKAWARLDEALRDAWDDDHPPATARSVVRGRVAALAPAFEMLTEDDYARIRAVCRERSFREADAPDWRQGLAVDAHLKWRKLREEALRRQGEYSQ